MRRLQLRLVLARLGFRLWLLILIRSARLVLYHYVFLVYRSELVMRLIRLVLVLTLPRLTLCLPLRISLVRFLTAYNTEDNKSWFLLQLLYLPRLFGRVLRCGMARPTKSLPPSMTRFIRLKSRIKLGKSMSRCRALV